MQPLCERRAAPRVGEHRAGDVHPTPAPGCVGRACPRQLPPATPGSTTWSGASMPGKPPATICWTG